MNKFIKKGIIYVCLFIIISTIAVIFTGKVKAETIKKYQAQISENNSQIQQMENIKGQLHVLAEMLRDNNYINNGLDIHLSQKWHECNKFQIAKNEENIVIRNKIYELQQAKPNKELVGYFKITHYCPCAKCNGSTHNKTASGTTLTPYRSIAVDPKIIPLGTKVEIQGKTYVAEDTGGAIKGNKIDICVKSHSEAYQKGVLKNIPVYIIKD